MIQTLDTLSKTYESRNKKLNRPERSGIKHSGGYSFLTDGFTAVCVKDSSAPVKEDPDIAQIIETRKNAKTFVTVNPNDMIIAAKNCGVFAREGSAAIYLAALETGEIYMTGESYETGVATRGIAGSYTGKPVALAINYEYIQTIVKFFAHLKTVTLEIIAPTHPVFIANDDRIGIIQPMALDTPRDLSQVTALVQDSLLPVDAAPSMIWPSRGSEHYEMETIETMRNWPCYKWQEAGKEPIRLGVQEWVVAEPANNAMEFIADECQNEIITGGDEHEYAQINLVVRNVTKAEPAAVISQPVTKVEVVTTYRKPPVKKVTIFTPKPAPVYAVTPVADPHAAVIAKYAWIARWEADPIKSRYKATINNAKVDLKNELAALDVAPINITAELAAMVKVTKG